MPDSSSRRLTTGAFLVLPFAALLSVVACSGKSVPGDDAEGGEGGAEPGTGGNGATSGNGASAGRGGTGAGGGAGAQGGTSSAGMAGTGQAGAGGSAGCSLNGKTYALGASFRAPDGCNDCTCLEGGLVACTTRGCAGNGGGASLTCDDVRAAAQTELAGIQKCESPDDCGQVLEGTSCGCTRNLVARLDADTTRFEELLSTTVDGEQCVSLASTCDCPAADGFACQNGSCTWNYAGNGQCSQAPADRLCVLGLPIDSGDLLAVGDPLTVRVFPGGCHSSSCTEAVVAECALTKVGEAEFEAKAEFCLTTTGGDGGCTDDCGGGGDASCSLEGALTEGEHTIRFGGATLSFTVPGLILPGEACVELSDDG
ncbi:MAG TPA: hypothetical protein VGK73_00110 [Polyangiaceae bacterium]